MNLETYRTFFGVEIGAPAGMFLSELQNDLKKYPGRIKWTDMSAIHITLSFLGDTASGQIETLSPLFQKLCDETSPFLVALNETGVFPHANSPQILWVGLDDETQTLSALKTKIDDVAYEAGFAVDRRSFVPHITLGRVKFLKPASELLHQLLSAELPSLEWHVRSINWYRSILKPSGAEYSILKKFELFNGGSV